jgi:hypothetical protein
VSAARDPEYAAGYRAGYHRAGADAERGELYRDGYANGARNRDGDDHHAAMDALDAAESERARPTRPTRPGSAP